VVDLGTGTGQAVLRRARAHPNQLVIGIDPDASAMADSSRRAAANPRKGGLANAMFLAGAAADLPGPLCRRADQVTIALPWGSLLRGVLTADQKLLFSVCAVLKPRGEMEILVSATDRDAAAAGITLSNTGDAQELGCRLESDGLQLVECRLATKSDVDRLSSGWGKRLGIPAERKAWLFRLRRKA
jgi:16S rRNA (adenine(1408)-N(1))-methyltransferase